MWQNLRTKSGAGLMMVISLWVGCSDSSAANNRDWDLQDPKDSVDGSEDGGRDVGGNEEDFGEGDCVHEGSIVVQHSSHLDKLRQIRCRTLKGGIVLVLNDDVGSIEDIGLLKSG